MSELQKRRMMLIAAATANKLATIIGNAANFTTTLRKPLQKCEINIIPTRATGTPTPSSPKSLSLPSRSITVVHSRQNLISESDIVKNYHINVSGQVSSNSNGAYVNYIPVTPGIPYYIMTVNKNNSEWTVRLHGYDENKTWKRQIAEQSVAKNVLYKYSFTPTYDIKYIRLSMPLNFNNTIVMVVGTTQPSPRDYGNSTDYQEYSIALPPSGKNLFNEATLFSGYYPSNGTSPDSSMIPDVNYRTAKLSLPAGTYTFSTNTENPYILRAWYDGSNHSITTGSSTLTFTTTTYGTVAVCWRNTTTTEIPAAIRVMIESGSIATTYTAATYNDWWGAAIDLVSGYINQTYEHVSASDITWALDGSNGVYSQLTGLNAGKGDDPIFCNIASYSSSAGTDNTLWWNNNEQICIKAGEYTASLSAWQTYISNNDIEIAYPLKIPIALRQGPEYVIPSFKGDNAIWSSGNGDCKIVYKTT